MAVTLITYLETSWVIISSLEFKQRRFKWLGSIKYNVKTHQALKDNNNHSDKIGKGIEKMLCADNILKN